MRYLKVFVDFADDLEALSDVEAGRLFRAMLLYAENGTLPTLSGNERFVWPNAKRIIDREAEYCSKQASNGSLGGRPRKAKETQNNPEKPKKTQNNPAKASETQKSQKDKDKDKDKEDNPPYPPKGPLDVAMDDFAAHRKAIKHPLTDKARELTLAELEKLAPGDDAKKVAIINQSIQRGWQGVFALKADDNPGGKGFRYNYDDEEGYL